MTKVKVKICCISSVNEAAMAIKHGAAALGLVGKMPSGPGVIDDVLIESIAKSIPPPIASFLLTSETSAPEIIAHYKRVNTSTIQLVDELQPGAYALLRRELPHAKLVQVIHVIDDRSVEQAKEVTEFVDAILLDSGNPNLAVKELGGTGRTHNWALSRQIVEAVPVPVFLAGGLNKDNVRAAIDAVQPFGIDLCSSVRSQGKLDEEKLQAFFQAIG
ncbi:MAG TPA: phosphoribosylanthranilate isomerase [Flavihumibacter sp.]|nr:phosphoribosylanthranilate isomerase [Bacteroidota bacterium]HOA38409.1 phosphoribosylanthranilate isomerase [Flavihumibacter sp.]HPZ88279.1 phosphoribosylanthranilate isomerase [Flavihumibacter sp.]